MDFLCLFHADSDRPVGFRKTLENGSFWFWLGDTLHFIDTGTIK